MSRVPTKDYARQYRQLWGELGPELERVFLAEEPVLGAAVDRFEALLARYHDVRHAIGVGSGTDAIILAVRGLGLAAGDEVVTGAHTFAGVVSALIQAGVEPRLADAHPTTGSLDIEQVERALSPRTRAVLAVHMYGHPVELNALTALCRERGLFLIEDVAQAHGARYAGRRVGGFGEAAVMSFHPSKNLGAFGDGGAVLTSSSTLAASLRIARNLGKDSKYGMSAIAPNSKLDTLQAAILEVKLRHLDTWVARRRTLAARYLERLSGVGDLILPIERAPSQHAYHLFVVRTAQRDALRAHLAGHDIQTGIHYPVPVTAQPALAPRFAGIRYPIADALARTVVSLPLSHELDDDEIDRVAAEVRRFFGASGQS